MSREQELNEINKNDLIAMIKELSEKLEEDISVSGTKDKLIVRIVAAEGKLAELDADNPDSDDGDTSESGDQADTSDDNVSDDSASDSEAPNPKASKEGELSIKALVTFETLVEGQKVLVCKGEEVSLPEAAALNAINEKLAEEI